MISRVDLLAVDLDGRVGDHIGGVERVLVGLRAIGRVDIVDQAFVQRPGVHAAFPVVDDQDCRSGRPRSAGRGCARPSTLRAPRRAFQPTAWRSARRRPGPAPGRSSANPRIWQARCRHRWRSPPWGRCRRSQARRKAPLSQQEPPTGLSAPDFSATRWLGSYFSPQRAPCRRLKNHSAGLEDRDFRLHRGFAGAQRRRGGQAGNHRNSSNRTGSRPIHQREMPFQAPD